MYVLVLTRHIRAGHGISISFDKEFCTLVATFVKIKFSLDKKFPWNSLKNFSNWYAFCNKSFEGYSSWPLEMWLI